MNKRKTHICPASRAGQLDNKIRKLLQNPIKILKPYVKEKMTALDIGCGPGFFSVDMAYMVGTTGKVIAADLQQEMLEKVKAKIIGTKLEERIELHKCEKDKIGVLEKVDFVLMFYMYHEAADQKQLLAEIVNILNPSGQIFIAEPAFHVSKAVFGETVAAFKKAGLKEIARPKMIFTRAAVFQKN